MDAAQLDSFARADHVAELRIAEKLLYRTLAHLAQLAGPHGFLTNKYNLNLNNVFS
jgi:hypothetical protein